MSVEIASIIDEIASRLGVAAGYVIPELAKLHIAQGAFACFALTIIFVVFMLLTIRFMRDLDEVAGITLIITVISFMLLAMAGYDLVGWVASPTAKTIEYVLTKVR